MNAGLAAYIQNKKKSAPLATVAARFTKKKPVAEVENAAETKAEKGIEEPVKKKSMFGRLT